MGLSDLFTDSLGRLGLGGPFGRRRSRASRLVAPLAEDIYTGVVHVDGRRVEIGDGSPFVAPERDPAVEAFLNGFSFLRHLSAADTRVARTNARALLDDWWRAGRALPRVAFAPEVVARRLRSFLSAAPSLLADAPPAFEDRFLASLSDHVRQVATLVRTLPSSPDRLEAAIAFAAAGATLDLPGDVVRRAGETLAAELEREVLPDGGPRTRRPDDLLDILAAVLPVLEALAETGRTLPPAALRAVDRMVPMLAFFRGADGAFARFNGTGPTRGALLATVLDAATAEGVAPQNARYAGYQRFEAGGVVVLMDTGVPPPSAFSARAHAGTLSFELSDAAGPIVGNVGAMPASSGSEIGVTARSTAAHSTLVVADTSSARIRRARPDRFGRTPHLVGDGPTAVAVARRDREGGTVVKASHDGYRRPFGLVHERTLALAPDGASLAGRDSLSGPGIDRDLPFAVRFHLGPGIKTSPSPSGHAVLLTTPAGTIWRFSAEAPAAVAIEDGIAVDRNGVVGPARQIVASATTGATVVVRWRLERQLA